MEKKKSNMVKFNGISFNKKLIVDNSGKAIVTKDEFTEFWKSRAWLEHDEATRIEMLSVAYDIITGAKVDASGIEAVVAENPYKKKTETKAAKAEKSVK
jgi:hypothetical protein